MSPDLFKRTPQKAAETGQRGPGRLQLEPAVQSRFVLLRDAAQGLFNGDGPVTVSWQEKCVWADDDPLHVSWDRKPQLQDRRPASDTIELALDARIRGPWFEGDPGVCEMNAISFPSSLWTRVVETMRVGGTTEAVAQGYHVVYSQMSGYDHSKDVKVKISLTIPKDARQIHVRLLTQELDRKRSPWKQYAACIGSFEKDK